MSERRWTGVILGTAILGGIIVYCWNVYNVDRTHTLSYGGCNIEFKYNYSVDTTDLEYPAANGRLAICLCEKYLNSKDPNIGRRVMLIYQTYGLPLPPDTTYRVTIPPLDTVVKYRKMAFDTLVALD